MGCWLAIKIHPFFVVVVFFMDTRERVNGKPFKSNVDQGLLVVVANDPAERWRVGEHGRVHGWVEDGRRMRLGHASSL